MLVPDIPAPFQPGDRLSASKFNRAFDPLQQLANLHVYPPLVLEQDATGYHIRLNFDLLTYIAGDITNPINFYSSATFWNVVNFSQATLIFPSSQPTNLYQGLIWIVPGSCSMYYYCDGQIKKVTATAAGGGGGGGGSAGVVASSGITSTTGAFVTLWDISGSNLAQLSWTVTNTGPTFSFNWRETTTWGNGTTTVRTGTTTTGQARHFSTAQEQTLIALANVTDQNPIKGTKMEIQQVSSPTGISWRYGGVTG